MRERNARRMACESAWLRHWGWRYSAEFTTDELSRWVDQLSASCGGKLRPIAIVTAYDPVGRLFCDWLESFGTVVMIVTDRNIPMDWIASRNGELACLVIDETYTGNAAAVRMVSRFRTAAPEIPIVRLVETTGLPSENSRYDADDASGLVLPLPTNRALLKLGVLLSVIDMSVDMAPDNHMTDLSAKSTDDDSAVTADFRLGEMDNKCLKVSAVPRGQIDGSEAFIELGLGVNSIKGCIGIPITRVPE